MRQFWLYLFIGVLMLLPTNLFARMQSSNYVIWADVFSIGGSENDSSANYKLSDTIGEAMILSATSTSANYGIKAGFRELNVDQFLTFTLGASSVSLGNLSVSAPVTASHTMTVNTNAAAGFTVTVSGNTLTSGSNQITAIGSTAAASSAGTTQFGINLVSNTSPSVGADPSGTSPIGSVASPYGTANQFAYSSGSAIASAASNVNQTVYTISYLANIASGTAAGAYSTTLTYAATANF